jgi:hypothetical protein
MGMRPAPGSWLLTHRPVWGFRSHRKTINATLQQALAAFDGALPDGIALALAGHIHVAEVLSFADKRAPPNSYSEPEARCSPARLRTICPAIRSRAPG